MEIPDDGAGSYAKARDVWFSRKKVPGACGEQIRHSDGGETRISDIVVEMDRQEVVMGVGDIFHCEEEVIAQDVRSRNDFFFFFFKDEKNLCIFGWQ